MDRHPPGVTTGKYDAAVTAILVTQERMKTLDFCSPVVESVDYYLKRKGDKKIQGIKDLSGLSLGVEAGSAMLKLLPQLDDMLKATGGKLGKIVSYQGYPEAYQDLALGRIDFVVNTRLSLESIAKAKPDTFEVGQAVSKPTYIAWAVVKGNTELLGHAQRVPARHAQGRHDVRAAEEVFRHHLREHAGGAHRKRLMRARRGTWAITSHWRRGRATRSRSACWRLRSARRSASASR